MKSSYEPPNRITLSHQTKPRFTTNHISATTLNHVPPNRPNFTKHKKEASIIEYLTSG